MKPGEFDDLFRQKFDQNDFAYNPRNWDRLAEEMDGRAKRRNLLMWLWMPVTGMAASVALAIGVTSLLHFGFTEGSASGGYASTGKFGAGTQQQQHEAIAMVPDVAVNAAVVPAKTKTVRGIKTIKATATPGAGNSAVGLKLSNMANTGQPATTARYAAAEFAAATDVDKMPAVPATPKPEKKQQPAVAKHEPMQTFREEPKTMAVRKKMNFSVILSGGVNQGNNNSGYMAGATVRKMINDKVYVESDIAFASSDNVQRTKFMSYENSAGPAGGGTLASKPASASKVSSDDLNTAQNTGGVTGVVKTQDISYNLSYAQITPGIGVKVMKRMSVGMGPDFQKMLVDNRPATSVVDRDNIQVAPTFDVGFIGKTEFAFTNRFKAAVAYRKGMNGFINPSDKFIDRDYLQFQMKCTIFNR